AEDGIRDGHVTGVQTCALPIFQRAMGTQKQTAAKNKSELQNLYSGLASSYQPEAKNAKKQSNAAKAGEAAQYKATEQDLASQDRSEERRVGKECRAWRSRSQ